MHRIARWDACKGKEGQYQLWLHHLDKKEGRLSTITFPYDYAPMRNVANFGGAVAVCAAIEHAGKSAGHGRVVNCIGAPAIGTLVRICYRADHGDEVAADRHDRSTLEFVGGAVFVPQGPNLKGAKTVGHERITLGEMGCGHVQEKVLGGEVRRPVVAAPWAMAQQTHKSGDAEWLLIPATLRPDGTPRLYAAVDPDQAGNLDTPWLVPYGPALSVRPAEAVA